MPQVPVWSAAGTSFVGCNQPAWAPSNNEGDFLPALMKANSCTATDCGMDPNNGRANVLPGDIVVHTVDPANGDPSKGVANFVFTLPSGDDGNYEISGIVWDASLYYGTSRPQDWTLLVNGVEKASGVLSGNISRSEAQAFAVLVHLSAGDTVDLELYKDPSSPYGFFVGTNLSITAQNFSVLHNFTGEQDGANPVAGVTIDEPGNLYGTTFLGGTSGDGAVYQLKHTHSGFVFNPLYSFGGGGDGANPEARVVFGPDGALYGTTLYGGAAYGTVFKLRPSPSACKAALCPWTITELYQFTGDPDGAYPGYGDLTFYKGNIYDTTYNGGDSLGLGGTVYEMIPSGNNWTESVLYRFLGTPDGQLPANAVIPDKVGNLFSTTSGGGSSGYGTVFELSPSGGGWTEAILYNFQGAGDGSYPLAGLVFDLSGNLYGASSNGGAGGGGTIFQLTPSGGGWTFSTIYSFTASGACNPPSYSFPGPWATLAFDNMGNLYGTTCADGAYGFGNVFELSPSNGGWTYIDLHDFTGGSDGAKPISNVVFDANGNLYGTAQGGGQYGEGVVWEITP